MKFLLTLMILLGTFFTVLSQYNIPGSGYVFDDSTVPRIDVFLDSDSLNQLLDDANLASDHLYPASVLFTKDGVTDSLGICGLRLRGNTSRGAYKKSFKINLDAFVPGNSFKGITKFNLNGQQNDPTIMRSKICFDMFNAVGVPSSRTNHVRLYINTQYRGLYLNTEHIEKEFLDERFSSDGGNLWKCLYPADLHYLGSNPNLYKEQGGGGRRAYDLKTNQSTDDYAALAKFIDVLNNTEGEDFKCQLEKIFDVENYLKALVLDVLISNWDGPIVNKNNFYLYHNSATGKITYIPYDLDNTLGIDWFNVDWPTSDIYRWSEISNQYRPIYEKVMAIPEYRNKVSFYYDKFIAEFFNPTYMTAYLDKFQNLIKAYRINDTFAEGDYGWTYDDFLENFDFALGNHVKYGLNEYFSVRVASAQSQIILGDIVPVATDINLIWSAEEILFEITAEDDNVLSAVNLEYNIDGGNSMVEDMTLTTTDTYTFTYDVSQGDFLYYRFSLTDDVGQQRYYPFCGFLKTKLGYDDTPVFVINELMASNQFYQTDEAGNYDDWIELYNATGTVLPIDKFYLSDNSDNPGKWRLPNTALSPNQYLIIWADEDGHQGNKHANFKLNKSGEFIGIFDGEQNNFAPIDTFTFPPQMTDESYGRLPNGVGPLQILPYPTLGYNNEGPSSTQQEDLSRVKIYPNPTFGNLTIDIPNDTGTSHFRLVDARGQIAKEGILEGGVNGISLPVLPEGLYFLNISLGLNQMMSQQIFVIR